MYETLPFQNVINVLVGYDIGKLSYVIVPLYMLMLSLFNYITLKFRAENYDVQDELS
ncbi:hypothetical protein [Clostridium nigeriense]|uniref:hypothetical protein n=1 Tax=Clostridium nigeriense TaxID=1805470 RepID=UPI003D32762D